MGRIIKNFLYNSFYQIIAIIIPLITAPYLARVLGAENVGVEGYVLSVSQIFYTIGMLGLSNYATREIAYVRDNLKERSCVFWEMMMARVIVFLLTLVVYVLVIYNSPYRIYFLIQIVWLFAMFFDASWLFSGMEIFSITVMRNLVVRILTIISIFIFVRDENDLFTYIALCALAQVVGTLCIFPQLKQYIIPVNIHELNVVKHFWPSIKVFLPQVASVLYLQIDKVMIENLANDTKQVAYYNEAEKLIKAPLALITAASTVMMPRIANEFIKQNKEKIKIYLENSLTFLMMMAWPVAFGMAGIASTTIPWFLGEGYEPASTAMIILSPIIIAIAASSLSANQYFLPMNNTKVMTISYTFSAVLNLCVNATLIPKYGFVGAAIGTIAAEFSVMIIQYYIMNKSLNIINKFFRVSFKYGLYSFLMYVIISYIGKNLEPVFTTTCLQVAVGVLVYAVLLLISRDKFLFMIIDKLFKRRNKI